MKKAILQAVNLVAPICRITENTSGMISCVAPPPRFPHPAAIPLAEPTTGPENIELIQNCVETKVASENPAKNRTMINPIGDLIPDVKYTAGAVESVNAAEARRGPKRSQAVPMTRRAKTEPDTEATPRIGITKAADWPLRYAVAGSPWTSRARVTAGRSREASPSRFRGRSGFRR